LNSLANYTNAQLIQLLETGDERAFSTLYDRYWKKLYAIAFNRLKESSSAEDIVHDVFVGLWSNRQTVQINNIEHYLAVAVKYAVLNRLKKEIREKEKRSAAITESPVIDFQLVETSIDNKKLLEKIWQEVESLPEKCRLIFIYSRKGGMPVKEIAQKLKLSPKTVENQLGKAVRHLKVAARSILQTLA
jgi:RNA polymerase sigma-70 factor (ECF subfamily)